MRDRGIGSERLARETGISVRLIRKYRAGQTVPRDWFGQPTENAVTLAKALGVNVRELFGTPTTRQAA